MKKSNLSNYPIGAKWRATAENGKIGNIWLAKRDDGFEMWMYSVCFSDGSSRTEDGDWASSYSACRNLIPIWNKSGKRLVFKRIK